MTILFLFTIVVQHYFYIYCIFIKLFVITMSFSIPALLGSILSVILSIQALCGFIVSVI